MELIFPAKTVMLRATSNNIVGFRRKGNTFVLGITNRELVKKCAKHTSCTSKMFLKELSLTNVKQDMDEFLPGFDELSFSKVLLDTDVKLLIEKKEP